CLLGPFATQIRAARHVTLLPFGPLGSIDIHALPFDGEPLLAGRSVAWSLDLGGVDAAQAHPPVALLVGDPRGDLPAARREVRSIEATLRGSHGGWRLELLEGERARYAEVL